MLENDFIMTTRVIVKLYSISLHELHVYYNEICAARRIM